MTINKNISVAVLPFEVFNQNQRLKTLIHGLTEDLITNLSKFVGLSVVSQFSTQQIKDLTNFDEIEKLGANFLVFGSIRNIADKLRITIQLIKSNDRSVIYSGQHNITVAEIFDTQDQLIQKIVSTLQKEIDYNLLSYSYKKEPTSLAAYEDWLMGMDCLKKGTFDSDKQAREYFEAALKIDPHYAPAYTGLSLSHFNEWSCQNWDQWNDRHHNAHKYALKAVEIDKNDYRALAILGRTYLFLEEPEKAEHFLRKSLRINPSDADNLIQIAFCMMFLGYHEESLSLYLKAVELDPLNEGTNYFAYGSNFYMENGDFKKSIELAKKTDIASFWTDFPAYVAAAYYHLSDFENMWQSWDVYLRAYEKNIHSGKEPSSETDLNKNALEWMINVNPYTQATNLTPFWDYVRTHKNISKQKTTDRRSAESADFLQKQDIWQLSFQGDVITVKDAKGLHDIHKLLTDPHKEFHAMELMGSTLQDNGGDAILDPQAKAEYHQKIQELQEGIAEAEDMNDVGRASDLQQEYGTILDHLSKSLGLGGKTREVGSNVEKARSAITWRIRSALKKIEKNHPPLYIHLSKSIKTGTFCSYQPEIKINWQLNLQS